jgi:hypothetical protein
MLTVQALRAHVPPTTEAFVAEYGPLALIEAPPAPVLQQIAQHMGTQRTVTMAHRSRLAERLVAMLRSFDHLQVRFLRPSGEAQCFTVGRLETCALPVAEPSVSKQHALLCWDARRGTCSVQDAGSLNGTFLNARPVGEEPHWLSDGDTLGFGDAQFLFLSSPTLHAHLQAA